MKYYSQQRDQGNRDDERKKDQGENKRNDQKSSYDKYDRSDSQRE